MQQKLLPNSQPPRSSCISMECVGRWFTPNRAVFCLTTVCTLNYLDRGIISGAALEIKGCARNWKACDLRPGQTYPGLYNCSYDCKACTCPGQHQTGFGINSQQLGYLQAAFMIGYALSSLLYSKLVHTVRPFKIISIALWLWIVAVVLSGISGFWCSSQQDAMTAAGNQQGMCSAFYLAIFARALSGVGEAATATIAVVYLDDALPPARKGFLFAIYFSAIPFGTALGFIYAGQIAAHGKWEWAFMGEAPLMIFFATGSYFIPFRLKKHENIDENKRGMRRASSLEHLSSALLMHDANVESEQREQQRTSSNSITSGGNSSPNRSNGPIQIQRSTSGDERLSGFQLNEPEPPPSSWSEIQACFMSPVYLMTSFGYASYTAVVAGFSFYGPMYIRERKEWGYSETQADLVFGGIVVFTGLVGTACGGILLDRASGDAEGSERLVPALGQVFVEVTIGAILCVLAGLCETAITFFVCLAFGVLVMFMTTAGVNVALMWSVPPENRAMAMALSVIIIHLLGDVPSPVVIGAIDRGHQPKTTFLCTASWLAWAVFCWGAAWLLAKRRVSNERQSIASDEDLLRVGGRLSPINSPTMTAEGTTGTGGTDGYNYEHPETAGETDDDLSPNWSGN